MADAIYMIGFRWVTSSPDAAKITQLEMAIASVGFWSRLNVHIWFVKSTRNAEAISARLRMELRGDDGIVVMKVDQSDTQGWAPKWFWEWLHPESVEAKNALALPPPPTVPDLRQKYYVTMSGNQWNIIVNGVRYGPYATQAGAINAAREAAKRVAVSSPAGAQVLVQSEMGQWRDESTYGYDPFPPRG